jgi:hypothetical protein
VQLDLFQALSREPVAEVRHNLFFVQMDGAHILNWHAGALLDGTQ